MMSSANKKAGDAEMDSLANGVQRMGFNTNNNNNNNNNNNSKYAPNGAQSNNNQVQPTSGGGYYVPRNSRNDAGNGRPSNGRFISDNNSQQPGSFTGNRGGNPNNGGRWISASTGNNGNAGGRFGGQSQGQYESNGMGRNIGYSSSAGNRMGGAAGGNAGGRFGSAAFGGRSGGGYNNNNNFSGGYNQGSYGGNQSMQNQQQQGMGPCFHEPNPRFLEAGCGHWDKARGHVVAERSPAVEEKLYKSDHVSTGINFNKYDEIPAEAVGSDVPASITRFEQAELHELLLQNIELTKYTVPTPVQKFSIPIVKAERDLMACAQTGSGKTAGFLFPILDDLFKRGPQYEVNPCPNNRSRAACPIAVILAPTRELAAQIYEEAKRFTYRSWVIPVVVYGGVRLNQQQQELRGGCTLLVATPGRLNDFLLRNAISLSHVRYLVLDEADRMLDMGFEPQIRSIVEEHNMPSCDNRTTLMFSATFPRAIQNLARDFLRKENIYLTVGRVGSASGNVKQNVVEMRDFQKRDCLLDILGMETQTSKTLVFVETKRMADDLVHFLAHRNYPAVAIHGDRDQREREYALEQFRSGARPILVATAVCSRGLDIPYVSHVVNYDMPSDIDNYVHQIGRTGRAGNPGQSTSFFDREKNFGLATDLIRVLTEANQVVPDFLNYLQQRGTGGFNDRGNSFYNRGRNGGHSNYRGNNDDRHGGHSSNFRGSGAGGRSGGGYSSNSNSGGYGNSGGGYGNFSNNDW